MSTQEQKRQVPLAIELGYKLALHATYFDSLQDQTIDAEYWSKTILYIKEQIDIINEYWIYFFGSALDRPDEIETQENLRDYLATVFRKTKAKIHIQFGDPIEAAFDLGNLFASNELEPPRKQRHDSFLNEIRDRLNLLGIKIDDILEKALPNLLSEEYKIRGNARMEVFNRIESLYGEKVTPSWLTGFEVTAGIPGLAMLKIARKT